MTNLWNKDNHTFFSATSEERVKMTLEVAPLLASILNKIHGTNYSDRFWSIITSPYISAIISSRLILEKENLQFNPTLDVFANTVTPGMQSKTYGTIRYLSKMIKPFRAKNKIKKQLASSKNISAGFHDKEATIPSVESNLETYYPFVFIKKTDQKKRNIQIQETKGFSPAFVKNTTKLLPKFYVEYFQKYYDKIPLIEPEKKVFHISMLENFFMKLIVAKYVEHGAKLYFYQHGGFYGEYEYHSAHRFESFISDKFLTWGWKMLPNDQPSKAFRLEKFKRNYEKSKDKRFNILIVFPTIESKNRKIIEEKSKTLLTTIDRKKFPGICARPRPTSSFNRKAVLSFLKKDVSEIDAGYKNIANLISDSKIVIQTTYPSTNMLECFYVDHPVVAILENNTPSEIVKPYYKFFLEKGVFHHSMESLVKHLNKIEVEDWWFNVIQHPTYKAFKNEFLREV